MHTRRGLFKQTADRGAVKVLPFRWAGQRNRELEEDASTRTPASLEAARELELRQEETLRLLQREVADLERQRDQL